MPHSGRKLPYVSQTISVVNINKSHPLFLYIFDVYDSQGTPVCVRSCAELRELEPYGKGRGRGRGWGRGRGVCTRERVCLLYQLSDTIAMGVLRQVATAG